jgi:hypothetical protein
MGNLLYKKSFQYLNLLDLINNDHEPIDVENTLKTFSHEKVLEILNTVDQHGVTLLMHAVKRGDPDTVKILINFGANVNSKDASGQTALFYIEPLKENESEKSCKIRIISSLLKAKCSINEQDNEKITCLHKLIKNNDTGIHQTISFYYS